MSVDYSANYGLGYEVIESNNISDSDIEDGLEEYLHINLDDSFVCFVCGCIYSSDMKVYVVLCSEDIDILDLVDKKTALYNELERLNVVIYGEFGLVGGLHIS